MEILKGELTFLKSSGEEKEILFSSAKRNEISCGSGPLNDIRVIDDEVDELHFKIYVNDVGKIKIINLSETNPILLNDEILKDKKDLKSGNIITIAGKKIRWETKADQKRRTAALTKEQRKEIKHKYLRTNRRITIHNVGIQNITKSTPENLSFSDNEKQSPESEKDDSQSQMELNDNKTDNANTSVSPPTVCTDKENEKTPKKAANLNHSGVLLTSYTPPAKVLTRSVSKTPYNSPMRSPLVKSAAKNILNESLNVENAKTPLSSSKKISSSMHLIDLRTPIYKRTDKTSSTPRSVLSEKKIPKPVVRTPRNQTLLKSVLKNSSMKKNMPGVSNANTPKGKVLFESPVKDSSSVIEVSLDSSGISTIEEIDSSKSSIIDVSSDSPKTETVFSENNTNTSDEEKVEKVPEVSAPNDDVKSLLDSISTVLGEDDVAEKEENIVSKTDTTIEKKFNEIVEQQKDSTSEFSESLFDKALNNVPNEAIESFDKLVTEENPDDANREIEKKGEIVLKLIADTRKSLAAEPNETVQVISSRFSNVTPNDSLVDTVSNISQKYDASTPKISMLFSSLDTKDSARKSEFNNRLTISPVSRLSVTKDSTVMVENYQLNTNNSKSLRSTRKRFGDAMASLHNVSQSCNTTFDVNESIDMSNDNKELVDVDVSQSEGVANILSLDEQLNTSNKENEYIDFGNTQAVNRIQFCKYVDVDENNKETSTVFEISNEDIDVENDIDSDSDIESSSEEEQEQMEEYFEEEYLEASDSDSQAALMKFRLSQQDLQEEGINILDVSKVEEQIDDSEDKASESVAEEAQYVNEQSSNISIVNKDLDIIPNTQSDLDDKIIEDEGEVINTEISVVHEEYPETEQLDLEMLDNEDTSKTTDLNTEKESKTDNDSIQETKDLDLNKSTEEHIEIPDTQEFNNSLLTEENNLNCSKPNPNNDSTKNASIIEIFDSTLVNSQEPINKSDSSSLSIQEISDATESEIYSQESNIKYEEMTINSQELEEKLETNENMNTNEVCKTDSNEVVNKSVMIEASLEATETADSLNTNISETINELVKAPTDILNEMAAVKFCSSSELSSDVIPPTTQDQYPHEEFPATQDLLSDEDIPSSQEILSGENNQNELEIGITESVEQDSAIESSHRIDHSNYTEKNTNDSVLNDSQLSPNKSEVSALFSDTELSAVRITTSFINRIDSGEEQDDKVNPIEDASEDKSDEIVKELEKVDSILPSESEKSVDNCKTLIPETLSESSEHFMQEQELKDNDTEEEKTENENNDHEENDVKKKNEETVTKTSQKYDQIEAELARMNEEPSEIIHDKRQTICIPIASEEVNRKADSRMTIIPPDNSIRKSFLENLEQEKLELKEKQPLEIVEEKLKPFEDIVAETEQSTTLERQDSNTFEEKPIEQKIVTEEPCIKKTAYVTTESDKEIAVPDTPSRRRVARVNYSELATGSPARSRKRSTSTINIFMSSETTIKSDKFDECFAEKVDNNDEEIQNLNPQELSTDSSAENKQESENQKHNQEIIQNEEIEPEVISQKEIVNNQVEETAEPMTPRKRAKKLNYLELASGSPARTPRRNVVATADKKPTPMKTAGPSKRALKEKVRAKEKSPEKTEAVEKSPVKTEAVEKSPEKTEAVEKSPEKTEAVEKSPEKTEAVEKSPENVRNDEKAEAEESSLEKVEVKEKSKVVETVDEDNSETQEQQKPFVAELSVTKSSRFRKNTTATPVQAVSPKREGRKQNKKLPGNAESDEKSKVVETITISSEDGSETQEQQEPTPKKKSGKVVENTKEEKPQEELSVTKSSRSRKNATATPVQAVSPKREGRKQNKKLPENVESDEKSKVVVTITISSEDGSETQEQQKPPPKKKGRKAEKITEEEKLPEEEKSAPKSSRSRRNKTEESAQEMIAEKSEDLLNVKRGRGKAVTNKKNVEEKDDEIPIAVKNTNKRAKNNVPEVVENIEAKTDEKLPSLPVRKRRGAKVKEPEANVDNTEENEVPMKQKGKTVVIATDSEKSDDAPPPKRGRKPKVIPEVHETKEKSVEPEPTEKASNSRGRKHKMEEPSKEPEALLLKRGRKLKNEVQEGVTETPKENPTRKGRGRKVNIEIEQPEEDQKSEKEISSSKRGKKETHATVPEVINEATTSKGRRRRKNTVEEEEKYPEVIEISSQSSIEKPVTKKSTRGRLPKVVKEIVDEKTETVPEEDKLPSPKRGGRKHKADVETESQQPVTKKGRGKQAKQPEDVEKSPSVTKSPPSRRNISKHVTILTPSTIEAKEKKTEVAQPTASKRAPKRLAQKVVEEPVATKRSMRSKK